MVVHSYARATRLNWRYHHFNVMKNTCLGRINRQSHLPSSISISSYLYTFALFLTKEETHCQISHENICIQRESNDNLETISFNIVNAPLVAGAGCWLLLSVLLTTPGWLAGWRLLTVEDSSYLGLSNLSSSFRFIGPSFYMSFYSFLSSCFFFNNLYC